MYQFYDLFVQILLRFKTIFFESHKILIGYQLVCEPNWIQGEDILQKSLIYEKLSFSPLDFISYLTLHIPDHYQHTRRYAGFYSAAVQRTLPKGKDKKIIKDHKPIVTLWAHLIAKIYGDLPIICPKCGDTMSLSGFITRIEDIRFIVHWTKRAPPKKTFASFDELTDNISYDYFDDAI